MIHLTDLSCLMQQTIEKGIMFVVWKSALPGIYDLRFTKYVEGYGVKDIRLVYHEEEMAIWQYGDETKPALEFKDADSALAHVCALLDSCAA